MRILHVLQWLQMGGAEHVALRLARAQAAAGHSVGLLSLGGAEGPLAAAFAEAGIPVLAPRARGQGLELDLTLRLVPTLARWRPRVVHTHDPRSLTYAGPAARAVGARLIHTKHGDDGGGGRRGRLLRAVGRLPHAFVAVSEATAAAARAGHEAPEERLQVIENGVALTPPAPPAAGAAVRAELGIPAEAVLIGAVGRLAPVKGPDLLLEAAARSLARGAHLLFVGDGPLRDALQASADASAHRARIHFAGLRHDIPAVLAALDLFVQPSRSEGLPLAVLEALVAARPVIATAVGGVPAAVGDGVRLVPPEDPAALAAALEALIADPAARAALAAGGPTVAARHDLAHTLAAYQALYADRR